MPKSIPIDEAGLIALVQADIERDKVFANPAIETLRIVIRATPPGERAPVLVQALGAYLRNAPNTSTLGKGIGDWLLGCGWYSDQAQVIDMRVHIKLDILPQYKELHDRNPEMVGWIQIEGTKVNYPVMQSPEDPEFYLHNGFNRKYAFSGVPFLDSRNDPYDTMQNLIVYGHNMKNRTMFGSLADYAYKGFWQKHPIVKFDTLTEQREYEVFAMFRSRRNLEGAFPYYDYVIFSSLNQFQEYVDAVTKASINKTGIAPEWGEQLLTLSTCSNHANDGLFVLVCRRIK